MVGVATAHAIHRQAGHPRERRACGEAECRERREECLTLQLQRNVQQHRSGSSDDKRRNAVGAADAASAHGFATLDLSLESANRARAKAEARTGTALAIGTEVGKAARPPDAAGSELTPPPRNFRLVSRGGSDERGPMP